MKILNVEDDVYKQVDISKAVKRCTNAQIDWVRNLEDAFDRLDKSMKTPEPYDLVITDMWYPEYKGGEDSKSGEILMERIRENGWKIPVILISSVNYKYPEIYGSIYYSKEGDWDKELEKKIKELNSLKKQ